VVRRPSFSWTVAIVALCLAGCGRDDAERPTVRVALDFTPNAAHAPIFAAARERHDDAGVRIDIREPSSSTDSLKLLATGRADLAVLDIHDLGLARERGEDLVGVSPLVNRQLASVIARPEVRRPRDLEGKRVGVTGLPSDDAVLRAVVERDGGHLDRVKRVTIGFTAVPSLVAKKVDAVTAFWNVEGVTLRRRGVRTREFRLDARGGRYPELVLVTTRAKLRSERERLKRAIDLIQDGGTLVLGEPEAMVGPIAKAAGADPALIRAEMEALRHAFVGGVQHAPHALTNWAEFDVRYGILKRRPDLERAFDTTLFPLG
jgi:NitT/TauT family transport system substrate-binding protein/putative hydroxymethylpyrimidine transport system substrate-binding protein